MDKNILVVFTAAVTILIRPKQLPWKVSLMKCLPYFHKIQMPCTGLLNWIFLL